MELSRYWVGTFNISYTISHAAESFLESQKVLKFLHLHPFAPCCFGALTRCADILNDTAPEENMLETLTTQDSGLRFSCSHIFGIYIIYNYIQLYIYTYYTYILYHIIQYYVTLYIHVIVHTFDCIYIWLYIHMIVYSRMILCRLVCRFLARILERPSITHAQISMWPWWMMGSSWTCRTLHRQKLGVAIWPQNCVSRSLTVLALSFEGTTVSGWLRLNFFVLKVCNSRHT